MATSLRGRPGFIDVVPGLLSIAVRYDPLVRRRDEVVTAMESARDASRSREERSVPELQIPVRYGNEDGPDFAAVCESLQLSREDFIAAHTGMIHTVDMLGFTPGFAYLSDMGEQYAVPRLQSPRRMVAAGSVGFAGGRSGLYALAGPGGWPLIGRTMKALFAAKAPDPFALQPGTRIRFLDDS